MNAAPSLLVLFVSGWAAAPDSPQNIFSRGRQAFLSDYLASYPTLTLRPNIGEPDLFSRYRQMGELSLLSDQAITLSAYLSGHGVRQIRIAGPDRFGLLTETMNGQAFPGEKEEWHYVPLPPANNLAAAPQSNLPLIEDAVERFARDKRGCVTFVAIDAIWSVGLCRDLRATVQAVAETNRTVQTLVEYALRHQMRVLICGDMGMAEAYVSADGERIEAKETEHPLPCLLIHPSVEGLRAGAEDYAAERVLPLQPLGALTDIPATIAALMGLPMPSEPVGKVLFAASIQATLS